MTDTSKHSLIEDFDILMRQVDQDIRITAKRGLAVGFVAGLIVGLIIGALV